RRRSVSAAFGDDRLGRTGEARWRLYLPSLSDDDTTTVTLPGPGEVHADRLRQRPEGRRGLPAVVHRPLRRRTEPATVSPRRGEAHPARRALLRTRVDREPDVDVSLDPRRRPLRLPLQRERRPELDAPDVVEAG